MKSVICLFHIVLRLYIDLGWVYCRYMNIKTINLPMDLVNQLYKELFFSQMH